MILSHKIINGRETAKNCPMYESMQRLQVQHELETTDHKSRTCQKSMDNQLLVQEQSMPMKIEKTCHFLLPNHPPPSSTPSVPLNDFSLAAIVSCSSPTSTIVLKRAPHVAKRIRGIHREGKRNGARKVNHENEKPSSPTTSSPFPEAAVQRNSYNTTPQSAVVPSDPLPRAPCSSPNESAVDVFNIRVAFDMKSRSIFIIWKEEMEEETDMWNGMPERWQRVAASREKELIDYDLDELVELHDYIYKKKYFKIRQTCKSNDAQERSGRAKKLLTGCCKISVKKYGWHRARNLLSQTVRELRLWQYPRPLNLLPIGAVELSYLRGCHGNKKGNGIKDPKDVQGQDENPTPAPKDPATMPRPSENNKHGSTINPTKINVNTAKKKKVRSFKAEETRVPHITGSHSGCEETPVSHINGSNSGSPVSSCEPLRIPQPQSSILQDPADLESACPVSAQFSMVPFRVLPRAGSPTSPSTPCHTNLSSVLSPLCSLRCSPTHSAATNSTKLDSQDAILSPSASIPSLPNPSTVASVLYSLRTARKATQHFSEDQDSLQAFTGTVSASLSRRVAEDHVKSNTLRTSPSSSPNRKPFYSNPRITPYATSAYCESILQPKFSASSPFGQNREWCSVPAPLSQEVASQGGNHSSTLCACRSDKVNSVVSMPPFSFRATSGASKSSAMMCSPISSPSTRLCSPSHISDARERDFGMINGANLGGSPHSYFIPNEHEGLHPSWFGLVRPLEPKPTHESDSLHPLVFGTREVSRGLLSKGGVEKASKVKAAKVWRQQGLQEQAVTSHVSPSPSSSPTSSPSPSHLCVHYDYEIAGLPEHLLRISVRPNPC